MPYTRIVTTALIQAEKVSFCDIPPCSLAIWNCGLVISSSFFLLKINGLWPNEIPGYLAILIFARRKLGGAKIECSWTTRMSDLAHVARSSYLLDCVFVALLSTWKSITGVQGEAERNG